ncbi:MAG: bifunctional pyr operon transcriptional regulator/uracil phosphoribosyltransferase PyrR [Thiotrichaceae bacterium]|uniref:Bifunctional pyr operon transcriptional regulator/uracil phosphoribosyltransferase PyrR n=1 Tax=Candidatus Thiocaldithrix dubininis TaxID=3080823 RepID=A0AA95H3H5_9GAMM|nr:MAG: bifunctional pyr operon transcriptional regulator/uracil phosphoribosyltransferase PyrR [Candidatus Thiocaldithrix dubininis]
MDNNYNIDTLISQLAEQIQTYLAQQQISNPLWVGIYRSGVWIAKRLQQALNDKSELGQLDVTFYRDDFAKRGLSSHPNKPTQLPHDINGRHILLIDDIVYTGRTIRGAMNELFDYGRPASITAAVLIARGGRELPIEPQLVALHAEPGADYIYEVSGPEPLALQLVKHKM